MRQLYGLTAAVVLAAATGCGGSGQQAGNPAGVTKESMAELKEMVEHYQKQKKHPPAKAADLSPMEPAFPDAVRLLASGECAYAWGAGLEPGKQAVLAYPKNAVDSGGPVLLQDGTIREMTAAEFASAPKAGKK